MKIITWNCNMAFRKKATAIMAHKPDILVVVECEHPGKMAFENKIRPKDVLWFGENLHKGIALFSFSKYRFRLHESYDQRFKIIVPVEVTGGPTDFNLFLVWNHNPGDKDGRYITQLWKAIKHYDDLLSGKPAILIGDFNSNTIWDRPRAKFGTHSEVVSMLKEKGIDSAYHHHHVQEHEKEKDPTFYLYRHKDKPYHLDYCFASQSILARLKTVEIGKHGEWTIMSDHVPVMVSFRRTRSTRLIAL